MLQKYFSIVYDLNIVYTHNITVSIYFHKNFKAHEELNFIDKEARKGLLLLA